MKQITLFLIILLSSWLQFSVASPVDSKNPLSKIVITSAKATCQKDTTNPHHYIFNYQEDVVVTFADQSTITAKNLEIVFDGKNLKKSGTKKTSAPEKVMTDQPKDAFLDKFKKIIFSGKVMYTSQNRNLQADKAELKMNEHLCTLSGNVTISQKKTKAKEVPVTIASNEATLNLQTQELTLAGSPEKPVNTVISLEDFEPLKQPQKNKKTQAHE